MGDGIHGNRNANISLQRKTTESNTQATLCRLILLMMIISFERSISGGLQLLSKQLTVD